MRTTQRLHAENPEHLLEAARLLRVGGLVAFPTETVYGLGANALDREAVAGIFAAKERPAWDPLIVHLARAADWDRVAQTPAGSAERVALLMERFWPGPLTLLLPRQHAIPDAVTAGRALVGVRVPAHPVAQALIAAAGVPIAAPSANRFGHVSPTSAEHVLADLDGRIDAVLDAGPCSVGVESTVVDPAQTPMAVYRQGAVTPAMLAAATGSRVGLYRATARLDNAQSAREALPSPGVGLRHYAPRAPLLLVQGTPNAVRSAAGRQPGCGVLWPADWPPLTIPEVVIQPWGNWSSPEQRAKTLFAALRALDRRGVSSIVCPLPPPGGLDDAIRERLEKAAQSG